MKKDDAAATDAATPRRLGPLPFGAEGGQTNGRSWSFGDTAVEMTAEAGCRLLAPSGGSQPEAVKSHPPVPSTPR